MKLTFLGTRGEIEARTTAHGMHTSLLVAYRRRRVMIDCGQDWLGKIDAVNPHAIVITHAHPDHAWGLAQGAPCPVYATEMAWQDLSAYPIEERHTLAEQTPSPIEGITFTAFPVEHSTRCPAVAYRIGAGHACILYAPDVVYIHQREEAFERVQLYIGDGATLDQSFVRKRGDHLIGHTPVRTQLTWCQKAGVGEAIITHCGSQIVEDDTEVVYQQVNAWGQARGVKVSIAYDGMERLLR